MKEARNNEDLDDDDEYDDLDVIYDYDNSSAEKEEASNPMQYLIDQ